jgi:hypothetical protein
MQMTTRLFALALVGAVATSAANAQSCLGYPALGSGGMNVSAQTYFPKGATTVLGQLNGGSDNGHFFGINAGFTSIEDGDVTPITIGAMFGIPRATGSINWCPVGDLSYRTEYKDINAGLSLAASFDAMKGSTATLSPFGSVGLNYWKPDVGDADGWIKFGVGLAVRLANGIVLAPSVDMTSQDGSESVLGLRVSLPLGGQ